MDVDKVFLMIPEFREVRHYDMQKAWRDFYKQNPEIRKEINKAQWAAYEAYIEYMQSEDPDYASKLKREKEFKDLFVKENKLKSYEYVEGVKDKFSKWFEDNKRPYYTSTELKKIGYKLNDENPAELTAQNLNRQQRNNLIIDIAFGILSHPSTAEKILNPGNFNTLKLMSRVASITEDEEMLKAFMEKFNCSTRQTAGKKLLEFIKERNLKVLDDFVKDKQKERNPLSPLTFAYYHQQNMTGAALIGMYANNTTAQAKFQQAKGFSISQNFTFRINGRELDSLSDAYKDINGIQELISKACAQWSAASVDNVKDPVLAMLLQNTKTANIAGALMRAGVTIEEVSLLFRQPVIVDLIKNTGGLKANDLKGTIAGLYQRLADLDAPLVSKKDIVFILKQQGISSEELMDAIVSGEKLSESEDADFLNSQLKILTLFKELISPLAQDMSELTKISRADSPNGAIAISLSKAKVQTARVKRFLSRRTGDKTFALRGLERVLDAPVSSDMSIDELREGFFASKMPMLQAFYSLGIDFGTQLIKEYFPQMNDSINAIIDSVLSEASDYWIYGQNDNLKQVYQDITTFALTKTKLFGDDGTNTFWDKYAYYMYEFPKHFMEAVNSNPEVAQLAAIRRMEVKNGTIVMNRSARLDKSVGESYMRSLDSLLSMDGEIKMTKDGKVQTYPIQKLAVDLFMYGFYLDGFNFGPNNYSAFLSSLYLASFPEYVEALRNVDKLMENSEISANFEEQLWAIRGSKMAFRLDVGSLSDDDMHQLPDGTLEINPDKVINRNKNNGEPYTYISVEGKLYKLLNTGPTYHSYRPALVILRDKAIYNANQSALELSESQIDPKVVEEAKNITPASQEDNMENFLDTMSAFNDINALPEDMSVQFEGLQGFAESVEGLIDYSALYEQFASLLSDMENYEFGVSDRLESIESMEDNQYDINEPNQELGMCLD